MVSQPVPGYNPYNPQQPVSQIPSPPKHPPYSTEEGFNGRNGPNGPPQQYQGTDNPQKIGKNKRKIKINSKRGKKYFPTILALILVSLISSGSTYFLMGGNLFTTPSEFEGKWYSGSSSGHIYLQEDGTIKMWDRAEFECFSGQKVPGSYVNDGYDDCSDGSDEETNRANTFNPEYQWRDYEGYYDQHATTSAGWSVVDEMFCFHVSVSSSGKYSEETNECFKAEVIGSALWIGSDDLDDSGEIEECEVMLKLTNRESGPQEWSQNWVDVWNFALEDAYSERPSFCKSTTFDSLQQEYYSY